MSQKATLQKKLDLEMDEQLARSRDSPEYSHVQGVHSAARQSKLMRCLLRLQGNLVTDGDCCLHGTRIIFGTTIVEFLFLVV
jgi:hypothetical protein